VRFFIGPVYRLFLPFLTFNSLCEIPEKWCYPIRDKPSFNSLCEIHAKMLSQAQSATALSILFVRFRRLSPPPRGHPEGRQTFFQFSLWDSDRISPLYYLDESLSILFVRFTNAGGIYKACVLTFNSLCEIPVIPRVNAEIMARLSILFVRFLG